MISELRIKCPSCGVILDIKNSKNEAIKRVTCPNCKKQLAVDFQEKPTLGTIEALYYGQLPISLKEGLNHVPIPGCEHLEINVVRIENSSFKYIVYSTSAEHPVRLNDIPLDSEDKALLAKGDKLKVGNTSLTFGKPSEQPLPDKDAPNPKPLKKPRKAHFYGWILGCAAMLGAVLLVCLCWPKDHDMPDEEGSPDAIAAVVDTPHVEEQPQQQVTERPRTSGADRNNTPSANRRDEGRMQNNTPPPSIRDLSDYELEQQAIKGNVSAQCELGKRWVAGGDSINIVKGIQYMKLAQQNGSTEAGNALRRVYSKLEAMSAAGNSTAENILREQR